MDPTAVAVAVRMAAEAASVVARLTAAASAVALTQADTLAADTADRRAVVTRAAAPAAATPAAVNREHMDEAATARLAAWKPAVIQHRKVIQIILAPSTMASGIRSAEPVPPARASPAIRRRTPHTQTSQPVAVAPPTAHGIPSAGPEALTS